MKMQSNNLLDSIIREALSKNQSNLIHEQAIPTPEELEDIKKYSYESNIKTPADAKEFRTWVRVNHQSEMMNIGLVSQEKFNTLEPSEQAKQKTLLKTAWKTYGKEYLGGSDDIDVDTNQPFYFKPGFIIGAILTFSAIALFAKYKLLSKVFGSEGMLIGRAAKKYRTAIALGRTDLSPKQVDELVDLILSLKRGARKDYLKKLLSTQLTEKEAVAAAEAIEKSPGLQNQIHVTLVGEAAENFINGKGFSEPKLKKAMGDKLWKQNEAKIKKARQAVTGEKPPVKPKTTTAAVTLKTMGKLKGTVGQQWANFQNAAASADDILNATRKSINSEVGLKTRIEIQNTVQKKLNTKLGSKQGSWLLTKHLKSSTFPDFTKWAMDVKSAGVTRKLTDFDYFVSKTLWNLAK